MRPFNEADLDKKHDYIFAVGKPHYMSLTNVATGTTYGEVMEVTETKVTAPYKDSILSSSLTTYTKTNNELHSQMLGIEITSDKYNDLVVLRGNNETIQRLEDEIGYTKFKLDNDLILILRRATMKKYSDLLSHGEIDIFINLYFNFSDGICKLESILSNIDKGLAGNHNNIDTAKVREDVERFRENVELLD